MRSTDLVSIFFLEQWTMLKLRSTSLLSIPPADPLLRLLMFQGAKRRRTADFRKTVGSWQYAARSQYSVKCKVLREHNKE